MNQRLLEPGWELVAMHDQYERRGVWMRVGPRFIEVCSGLEGNDYYVRFTAGVTVTEESLDVLAEALRWPMTMLRPTTI